MSIAKPPDPCHADWQSRCNLAASILNQREPSAKTARMATAALAGADVDALMVIDKVGA